MIGDAVNVSQRLQSADQPNQIVITDVIYERVKESFQCEPIGELNQKQGASHYDLRGGGLGTWLETSVIASEARQ